MGDPRKVYVLEEGEYSSRGVVGVYASPEAAMDDCNDEPDHVQRNEWKHYPATEQPNGKGGTFTIAQHWTAYKGGAYEISEFDLQFADARLPVTTESSQ